MTAWLGCLVAILAMVEFAADQGAGWAIAALMTATLLVRP